MNKPGINKNSLFLTTLFLGALFFAGSASAAPASTISTTTPPVASTTPLKIGILNSNSKIRKTPEISVGNVNEILPLGTSVKIIGSKEDWYEIEYGLNKNGWVFGELVSVGTSSIPDWEKKLASTTIKFPVGITEKELNEYWLRKINALRKAKNLKALVIDKRFIKTASLWAAYMGKNNKSTHTRPDGKNMHQWIDTKGIPFTKRNSPGGWKANYFSENIGFGYTKNATLAGVEAGLDEILRMYLREGPRGPHFRSVYHPDWNALGVGWYPVSLGNGTYKLYFTIHYGSLVI